MEENKDKTLFDLTVEEAKDHFVKSFIRGGGSKGIELVERILDAKDTTKVQLVSLKEQMEHVASILHERGGCDSLAIADDVLKLIPAIDKKIAMAPEIRTFSYKCTRPTCKNPCTGKLIITGKGYGCIRNLFTTKSEHIKIAE